jgi:hypothetical protein
MISDCIDSHKMLQWGWRNDPPGKLLCSWKGTKMLLVIALDERNIELLQKNGSDWVGHTFDEALFMCDFGSTTVTDEALLDKLRMNEDELRLLQHPLSILWDAVRGGIDGARSVFELNDAAAKVLRSFASVSRTLNCSKSLCRALPSHERLTLLLGALQCAEPILNELHYTTRDSIWTYDIQQEADTYDIKYDEGWWYIHIEGVKGMIGFKTEWDAIGEIKRQNFRLGRAIEERRS